MSDRLKTAIDKVYNELLALNSDEFGEMLDRHEDGDIAKIILETGALAVGKIESDGFASQAEDTYYTFPPRNDTGVIGWADNLGFLPSDVKSSILCTGKEINYSFIDIRQPDEFIITTKSENMINVGRTYIGYCSGTVTVNFEEAYSVADNYDWAEAA